MEKPERNKREYVRQNVLSTLEELRKPDTIYSPTFIARNLDMLIARDEVSGLEDLSRVLTPHWDVLWRVARRGHYFVKQEPVRELAPGREYVVRPHLYPVEKDGFTLDIE